MGLLELLNSSGMLELRDGEKSFGELHTPRHTEDLEIAFAINPAVLVVLTSSLWAAHSFAKSPTVSPNPEAQWLCQDCSAMGLPVFSKWDPLLCISWTGSPPGSSRQWHF